MTLSWSELNFCIVLLLKPLWLDLVRCKNVWINKNEYSDSFVWQFLFVIFLGVVWEEDI